MENGVVLPEKPRVQQCLDLGFEIMERLLIKNLPLTDDLIEQYILFWLSFNRREPTDENISSAFDYLMSKVDLLSRCSLPIPRGVAEQVCMCSTTSMTLYIRMISQPVATKVMSGEIWQSIPDYQMPRFQDVMYHAMSLKLTEDQICLNAKRN